MACREEKPPSASNCFTFASSFAPRVLAALRWDLRLLDRQQRVIHERVAGHVGAGAAPVVDGVAGVVAELVTGDRGRAALDQSDAVGAVPAGGRAVGADADVVALD